MANDMEKTLQLLMSLLDKNSEPEEEYNEITSEEETQSAEEPQPDDFSGMLGAFSGEGDKRVNLLSSIKPYMNGKRQEKVDTAINMVKVLSFSSMLGLGSLFDIK